MLLFDDRLSRAAEITARYAQADLPVLLDGDVVGLLTRRDLVRWLSEDGSGRSVGDAMNRTVETVDASAPLDAVFSHLQQEPDKTLLVTDRGQLVGLASLDEITTVLRVTRATARPA